MLIIRKTIEVHAEGLDDAVIDDIIEAVDDIDFAGLVRQKVQDSGVGHAESQLRVKVQDL